MSKNTHKNIRIPRPEEIVAHLSEAIKGHDQIKRMLACAAYAHLMKCYSKSRSMHSVQSLENCLIAGPTASGKSSMLQRLASYLRMPTVTVLTGSLSPSGYKGKTCTDVLGQIEEVAVDDGVMTPTLCVWDELDKIAYHTGDGCRAEADSGEYKRMTQSDMLGIIQGISLTDRPGLKLNHVLHVGCGAFPERSTPRTGRRIGFLTPQEPEVDQTLEKIGPDYFIGHGLMPELVGRFPRLGMITKPDHSTIREILTESSTSPYKQKLWHFQQHGTQLLFDDEALDLLARMISEHPTGVRAIQLVLNQLLSEYEYEITRSDRKSIEEIRFTRGAVAGHEEPMIIRSSTNNTPIERTMPAPKPDSDDDADSICVF